MSLKCSVAPRAKQLLVRCFPDAFLPGGSPWKRAFLGTLVALPLLLALLMTLALYFFQKQRQCQGKGQTGLGGGVCVRVVSRLARALLGRKCWRRKGHPGGAVPRRLGAGVGPCRRRASTRPHLRPPSLDLSEKLRKHAEKDKGKQGEGRTPPVSLSSRKWWEKGEDLVGGGGKDFRPRGTWEQGAGGLLCHLPRHQVHSSNARSRSWLHRTHRDRVCAL